MAFKKHTSQRSFNTTLRIDCCPWEASGDRISWYKASGNVCHPKCNQFLSGNDFVVVNSCKCYKKNRKWINIKFLALHHYWVANIDKKLKSKQKSQVSNNSVRDVTAHNYSSVTLYFVTLEYYETSSKSNKSHLFRNLPRTKFLVTQI